MIQLNLNVLLVIDFVTTRCGSQVQTTKMTIARQQVLSSSEGWSIRSRTRRVVGSNPIWGSDFFCVLLWLILYISLYSLYNIELLNVKIRRTGHGDKLYLFQNMMQTMPRGGKNAFCSVYHSNTSLS